METFPNPAPHAFRLIRWKNPRANSGVALVIVLSFLVIITVLTLAFFSSVTTETVAAKNYSSGVTAKQLADSAVQLVMSQIKSATSQGANVAWASQPGMIRTYGSANGSASSAPLIYFKLYSSGTMEVPVAALTGTFDPGADVDSSWNTKPSLFTDLNSCVTDASGVLNFPIIDGNGLVDGSTLNPPYPSPPPVTGTTYLTYNTSGATTTVTGSTSGFFVAKPATYDSSKPISAGNNPVPMPTRWLYLLKDGSITAPVGTDATGNIANWQGAGPLGPSATNPIVARIAFWTDDETCKVNLNTACGDLLAPGNPTPSSVKSGTPPEAGGAFWDTPRAMSIFDYDQLNGFQPVQFEYQRYPGHPATVYLTGIFPNITSRADLFSIVPRISGGGSDGGTKYPTSLGISMTSPVTPDADRLYASIDELMFKPTLSGTVRDLNNPLITKAALERAKFFLTTSSRAPEVNLFNQPRVSMWPISTDLVAKRGSATPSPNTTAFDNLIAFCSHTGPASNSTSGYDYFFQRSPYTLTTTKSGTDPVGGCSSPTTDATIARNAALYAYCQKFMANPVPGFGGTTFTGKYPSGEADQILTEMFDYIRCVNPCDDVIAYKGIQTPHTNGTNDINCYTPGTTWVASDVYGSQDMTTKGKPGRGCVAPMQIVTSSGPTSGFGRFPTIVEAGVEFICTADGSYGTFNAPLQTGTVPYVRPTFGTILGIADQYRESNQPYVKSGTAAPAYGFYQNLTLSGTALGPNERRLEAMFIMQPHYVTEGVPSLTPSIQIEVTNLDSITINGNSIGFPHTAILRYNNAGWADGSHDLNYSCFFPNLAPARGCMLVDTGYNTTIPGKHYPFLSIPFTVPVTSGSTMVFESGTVGINIYYGATTNSANLVQTLNLDFSHLGQQWPIPTLYTMAKPTSSFYPEKYWTFSANGVFGPTATVPYTPSGFQTAKGLLAWDACSFNYVIPNCSVIRSLVAGYPAIATYNNYPHGFSNSPAGGDFRMIAARKNVTADYFVPHRYANDATQNTAYSMGLPRWQSGLASGFGADFGVINPFLGPSPLNQPLISSSDVPSIPGNNNVNKYDANVKPEVTGDWDNGNGWAKDGAYINTPDGGEARHYNSLGTLIGGYFYSDENADFPGFFSPNRQVCSPGMFGSLPTGVIRGKPWETLLFRPQPGHPNATSPEDHLLMDLFWMPVVEPYAISEPFSTAGKINMNYQIAPFTYINRQTAMDALLLAERLTAIPTTAKGYKDPAPYQSGATAIDLTHTYKLNLNDTDGTLRGFKERFSTGDIFHSATEICDIFLAPDKNAIDARTGAAFGPWTSDTIATTFWSNNLLTGDNTRERPYATLYARLTTKSNTYTVHYRVQSLQKIPSTDPTVWVEGQDKVTSEFRGSSTIERYVDANDPNIPDFADPTNTTTLDSLYKFRVITSKKFAP